MVKHSARTIIEPLSSLGRRGYWDRTRFPHVAAFAALPRQDQDEIVANIRPGGSFTMIFEYVLRSKLPLK